MFIKIIRGNYGYNNGEFVRVKTPLDPPFSVSDEEARRLVALGVAEAFGTPPAAGNNVKGAANAPESGSSDIPPYSDMSTKAELQAIAKEYGVDYSERWNKTELIKVLDDYFSDMPDLSEV